MRTFVVELDALPSLREAAGAHEVDLAAAATLAELAGVDAVRLGVNLSLRKATRGTFTSCMWK